MLFSLISKCEGKTNQLHQMNPAVETCKQQECSLKGNDANF